MSDENETAKPNVDAEGGSSTPTEQNRDVKDGGDSTLTIRFRDQTGEEVMCMNGGRGRGRGGSCLFRAVTDRL